MTFRARFCTSPCHGRSAQAAPWLALSLLAAGIGSAYAQSQPAPAAPAASAVASAPAAATSAKAAAADATELETVTVSGTRRKELIREVPLAISSVPAERLQETGAKTMNDYLATQPGVVQQNSGVLDNGGYIIIRGLTTGIDSNSPTTVYIDDTPLAAGTTFDINLLDLRRFEVLRGPQGTLYGSSAMGGIVKYVTNDPDTSELSGKAFLGLSHTQHGALNNVESGVVNVPLKEDFAALRVAVFGERNGGYVDATGPAGRDRVNRDDSSGGRASLLITPNRDLSVKLTAMTQTRNSDGGGRVVYDAATHAPAAGDLVFTDLGVAEPRKGQRDLYSATIDYDLQWARFSSITSTQTAKDDNVADYTALGAAAYGLTTAYVSSTAKNEKTTQEFRLVSQTAGPIQWLAGLFFDKFKLQTDSMTLGTAGGAPFALADSGGKRDYKEYAAYGNVTWNVTSDLALTGGLRVAHYTQTDTVVQAPLPDTSQSFGETPKTYLLTAKYRLTSESNVYARAASGYRPGGANFSAGAGAPTSYGTDTVWTYEAGYKATFPAARASLDIAVFDTEWKNLQQFVPSSDPLAAGYTGNLGKARIQGLEASGTVQPLRDLTIGGAMTLMNPKLLTDSPGLGGVAGDRLPNSPKFAATVTTRYDFAVAGKPSFAGLNASYQGDRNSNFPSATANPNYVMPSFVQFDLSAGVALGRFDLGFYVRNLTDKRGQIGAVTSENSIGRTYVHVIDPRTIGVNLAASF
jgi:outer membrane receptor protein involved in Fe transport